MQNLFEDQSISWSSAWTEFFRFSLVDISPSLYLPTYNHYILIKFFPLFTINIFSLNTNKSYQLSWGSPGAAPSWRTWWLGQTSAPRHCRLRPPHPQPRTNSPSWGSPPPCCKNRHPCLYMLNSLLEQQCRCGWSRSRPLNVFRVGRTEHQSLTVFFGRHSRGAHQAAHVRLKPHIQHPVSLVQHQVPQFTQPNL